MTRLHPVMATRILVLFLSASVFLCGTTIVAVRAADPKQPPEGEAKKLLQNLKDQDQDVWKAIVALKDQAGEVVMLDFDDDELEDIVHIQVIHKPKLTVIVNLYRNEGNGRFSEANDKVSVPKTAPKE